MLDEILAHVSSAHNQQEQLPIHKHNLFLLISQLERMKHTKERIRSTEKGCFESVTVFTSREKGVFGARLGSPRSTNNVVVRYSSFGTLWNACG